MKLRPTGIRASPKSGQPVRLRLATALAGAVVLALTPFAGRAGAGASTYPSPLYLAGGASTLVSTSFQLVGDPPPVTPGTPTVSLVGGGSLTGTYGYIVVAGGSSGPDTGSLASSSAVASSQNITVGNLPSGTAVDIYRQKSGCSSGTNCPYYYVGNSGGATSYTDSLSDASAAANKVLPEAANRITTLFSSTCAATTCGYLDFSLGVEPAPGTSTNLTPPTLAASPSATPNNKGWIVDGAGSVSFPAGTWTFQVRTKSSNSNGVAHLVVGVWKVTTSGGVVATSSAILGPTCTGVGTPAGCPGSAEDTAHNMVTATATVQTIAYSVSLPSFSLAPGEHLYLQFWRRQTTAYSTGGGGNRLATMMAYDSLAQITHPAAVPDPTDPTLQTPADGTRTNSSTLAATFSDPDAGDTGTVSFQVCADSACSSVVASGSVSGVANGATASWTAALADGTYHWQAQAMDAAGGLSNWTATRSFTLDTVPPETTIFVSPADPSNSSAASFSFSASEAGSSFQCQLDGGGFADCTSPQSYAGLSDGSHSFDVKATDQAGNTSTASSYSWRVDTTLPTASITSQPANPTNSTSAGLGFSGTDDVTPSGSLSFQCSLDGGGFADCTSPQSYSGLSDGGHSFDVKATDAAGNTSTASSYSWTVDTTLPTASITSQPANPTNSTSASFSFRASKAGSSFQCSLDGGGFADCTSPQSYSGLSDGSHSFQVKATGAAGNTNPTPAGYSWTVDTVPPATTIGASPADPSTSSAASFGFSASEAGSSFRCQLDDGNFAACTSPQSYSGLADGSHRFRVKATDAARNTESTPASYGWTIDTTPPYPPALSGPGDQAWKNSLPRLGAVFTDPNGGRTGTVTFRVCSDSACAGVLTSGSSPVVKNKATAGWMVDTALADGTYYWQAYARDASGNQSGWTATRSFTLDTVAPGAPGGFVGVVAMKRLTLWWVPPAGDGPMDGYVLYVRGARRLVVDGATLEIDVGKFDANNTRTFAVAAVDKAGNQGPLTATLVGVPNLIGLNILEATVALAARGLVLGAQTGAVTAWPGIVAQTPAAPAVAPTGSSVAVVVGH
jgi:hypothetical protein